MKDSHWREEAWAVTRAIWQRVGEAVQQVLPPHPRFHRAELLIRDNVASGPVHAQPAAQSLALRFASVVIKTEQMGVD